MNDTQLSTALLTRRLDSLKAEAAMYPALKFWAAVTRLQIDAVYAQIDELNGETKAEALAARAGY
jgi:hypothetical protein